MRPLPQAPVTLTPSCHWQDCPHPIWLDPLLCEDNCLLCQANTTTLYWLDSLILYLRAPNPVNHVCSRPSIRSPCCSIHCGMGIVVLCVWQSAGVCVYVAHVCLMSCGRKTRRPDSWLCIGHYGGCRKGGWLWVGWFGRLVCTVATQCIIGPVWGDSEGCHLRVSPLIALPRPKWQPPPLLTSHPSNCDGISVDSGLVISLVLCNWWLSVALQTLRNSEEVPGKIGHS